MNQSSDLQSRMTDDERIQAHREAQQRYYWRKKNQ